MQLLVNNAGIASPVRGDMLELKEEDFDLVLDVNLKGSFFLSQAIAREMTLSRDDLFRSIVFISSVSAELASIERSEYCISKSALSMAAKLFALRLADEGIAVYELRPGIIETDMTSRVREGYTGRIQGGLVPQRRWGTPRDVGRAVAALARGDFAFSTGQSFYVDGGLGLARL